MVNPEKYYLDRINGDKSIPGFLFIFRYPTYPITFSIATGFMGVLLDKTLHLHGVSLIIAGVLIFDVISTDKCRTEFLSRCLGTEDRMNEDFENGAEDLVNNFPEEASRLYILESDRETIYYDFEYLVKKSYWQRIKDNWQLLSWITLGVTIAMLLDQIWMH